MKDLLIIIINSIHLSLAILLIFGGYIIPSKYIPMYLLGCPFMIIDWNDGDGLCHLTKLKNMVQYESINPIVDDDYDNNFINNLLRKLDIQTNHKTITMMLYLLISFSWLYAYLRFIRNHTIRMFPNQLSKYIVYSVPVVWFTVTFI